MQITITPEELEKLAKGEVVKSSSLDIEIKVVKNKISWEDFPRPLTGYFVNYLSDICPVINADRNARNNNLFRTEAQARASLALSQLSQWMYLYNEGCEPNWSNMSVKFCIYFDNDKILKGDVYHASCFLAFKSAEIRDKFLEDFKDLIMEAKPLL